MCAFPSISHYPVHLIFKRITHIPMCEYLMHTIRIPTSFAYCLFTMHIDIYYVCMLSSVLVLSATKYIHYIHPYDILLNCYGILLFATATAVAGIEHSVIYLPLAHLPMRAWAVSVAFNHFPQSLT